MNKSYPNTLTLSRRVLRVLTKLNLLMGALILALLIASLIAESWVMGALGARPSPGNSTLLVVDGLLTCRSRRVNGMGASLSGGGK